MNIATIDADTITCNVALNAFRAALGGEKAAYLSCPIESGRWRYEGLDNYREANRNKAIVAAHGLRRKGVKRIIEPARFEAIQGWIHEDYMAMWYRVLDELVEFVVLVDYWQYSGGCCSEFVYATEHGILCFDERRKHLGAAAGLEMMRAASEHIEKLGHVSTIREAAIEKLTGLIGIAA